MAAERKLPEVPEPKLPALREFIARKREREQEAEQSPEMNITN